MKRATRLYLKDNNIEKLEPVYDKNTILCEIELQNNGLVYVHPEFTTNLKVRKCTFQAINSLLGTNKLGSEQ